MEQLISILSRTRLKDTDAVKNGRVYLLYGYCTEAVARSFIRAYYMAKWFHTEQFKDLDPETMHKEYFEKWLGVPYKGIWAYHQGKLSLSAQFMVSAFNNSKLVDHPLKRIAIITKIEKLIN